MKAVIWTDVYQSIWMLSGFLAVIIAATIDRVSQADFVTFIAFYMNEFILIHSKKIKIFSLFLKLSIDTEGWK